MVAQHELLQDSLLHLVTAPCVKESASPRDELAGAVSRLDCCGQMVQLASSVHDCCQMTALDKVR